PSEVPETPSLRSGTLLLFHRTCFVRCSSLCLLHHAESTRLCRSSKVRLASVFFLDEGASFPTPPFMGVTSCAALTRRTTERCVESSESLSARRTSSGRRRRVP